MSRKLIFVSAFILVCCYTGFSQQVQLRVASNPPQFLADWENQKQLVIVTITSPPGQAPKIRIGCVIQSGNNTVARTDIKRMPVVGLDQPVKIFYTDDVMPANALIVTLPDNKLPEGAYTLCVRLFDETGQRALTQPVCQPFSIRSYQQPQLILPADKSTLLPAQAKTIQFRWTPVSPAPTGIVNYKLQVFEVMNGQYPEQAVRSNQPVLEKDLPGATQFIWIPQNDIQPIQYVWTVQALDREGRPIGKQEGRATPFVFKISEIIISNTECSCGKWSNISMSIANGSSNNTKNINPNNPPVSTPLDCGKKYDVQCSNNYVFQFSYQCNPISCNASYDVAIKDPSNNITQYTNVNPASFSYSFTSSGQYAMVIIPKCGNKVCDTCKIYFNNSCADCCKELLKEIKDQKPWLVGNQLNINTIFIATQPIQSVEATIISMQSTVVCTNPSSTTTQPIAAVINSGSLSGYSTVIPYQSEIDFSGGSSTTVSPFIQLQLPPPPSSVNCKQTIKVCIRYLLRYANCKTCEAIRCYSITRNGGIIIYNDNNPKRN